MPHPTQHSTIGPPWPAAKTLDYGRTPQRHRISSLLSQAAAQRVSSRPQSASAATSNPQPQTRAQ